MELFLVLMCVGSVLSVQPTDTDRHTYCESCLTIAQVMEFEIISSFSKVSLNPRHYCAFKDIEEAMREAPTESRHTVAENLIGGDVCKKLQSNKQDHKLMSSCSHLLESNYDKFRASLVNKEPKNLDIVLCYEQSTACVGVKRQSFQDSKATFKESDVDALLREHQGRVRVAQPVRSDEL